MLTNAVFVAEKPKINIIPKMLASILECAMAGEEYVTFCLNLDDENYIKSICKALEKNSYKTEVFTIISNTDLADVSVPNVEGIEEYVKIYYIKVSWDNKNFTFIQKKKQGYTYVN